jgi:hypothetical protein
LTTPPPAHIRRIAVLILHDGRLLEAWIMASAGLTYQQMASRTGHSRSTMRRRAVKAQTIIAIHYEEDVREYC